MTNSPRNATRLIAVIGLAILAGLLVPSTRSAMIGSKVLPRQQTTPSQTVKDGLRTATVDAPEGRVTVKLPDDIRTGDTISGTLVVEPKGTTDAEMAQNLTAIRTRTIKLLLARASARASGGSGTQPIAIDVPLSGSTSTATTSPGKGTATRVEFKASEPASSGAGPGRGELARVEVPIDLPLMSYPKLDESTPAPTPTPREIEHGPAFMSDVVETLWPEPPPEFKIPRLGQSSHSIQITGPFDGSSANTKIDLTMGSSSISMTVPLDVIAESPRKSIVDNPSEMTGPGTITIKETGMQAIGPFRNIGVSLSAPSTSLIRGERTTLTVTVTGLEGIKQAVPMTLESRGVINMQGGPYQQIFLHPSDVGTNGVYTTTRGIVGIQAGTWGATATVILDNSDCFIRGQYVDFLARDDTDPGLSFWISSFNGDFHINGPDRTTFEGVGKVKMNGCIIDLTGGQKGLKVQINIDACTKTATATVQPPSPGARFTITDRDIRDNFCPSPR